MPWFDSKSVLRILVLAAAPTVGCTQPTTEPQPNSGAGGSNPAAATTPTAKPANTPASPPGPTATGGGVVVAARPDWPVLEQADEGFRIALPGRPEALANEVDTPTGKVYMRLYSLADDARRRAYSVAVNRLPTTPAGDETSRLLDRARDGALKLVGGRVTTETEARYGEHLGRSLVVELPGGAYVHARLIVAGDRLFQVSIVSDSEQLSPDDRRVFGSIEISSTISVEPRPTLPWRFVTPEGSTFAVEMPGDPQERVGLLNTPLGRVDLRRLEAAAAGRTFFVQSCDLPTIGGTATAKLDAARDHVLRETKGRLLEETGLTLDSSEGRAVAVAVGDRTMWMRTYVDGSRIYQIGVVGTGTPTADDRRFFASLRLSERKEAK